MFDRSNSASVTAPTVTSVAEQASRGLTQPISSLLSGLENTNLGADIGSLKAGLNGKSLSQGAGSLKAGFGGSGELASPPLQIFTVRARVRILVSDFPFSLSVCSVRLRVPFTTVIVTSFLVHMNEVIIAIMRIKSRLVTSHSQYRNVTEAE